MTCLPDRFIPSSFFSSFKHVFLFVPIILIKKLLISIMQADPLQDVSAQYRDPRFEHIVSNGFPNIGSPILPYTDYFFGNMNHGSDTGYVNNSVEDPLNEFLNAVLSNQDEYSSGACNVLKDSVAESLPRHSIWDSASCRDSRASSDIDTEATLPQVSSSYIN